MLTAVQPSGNSNLCTFGTPQNMTSTVSGGKHIWSWQCGCAGTCSPGYTTASCSATDSTAAECGTANGQALATAPSATPSTNLCTGGLNSGVTALGGGGTTGPWSWTCTGTTEVSCSANLSAGCGTANGTTYTSASPLLATATNLCATGNTMANFATNVTGWAWNCNGSSGETASCSALLSKDGVCGSDNGKVLMTAPTNLCSPATAVTVTKVSNGWTWPCAGSNGGSTANCAATEAPTTAECGPGAFQQITCPDDTIDVPPPATDEGKCTVGTPSVPTRIFGTATNTSKTYYSGHLYWEWTCATGTSSVKCQVPICSCAMCGLAFNNTSTGASATAPSGLSAFQLCVNGVYDSTYGMKSYTTNAATPYYNPTWFKWWVWRCILTRDDGSTNVHTCHVPRQ
jgi:hypothetical protein